MKRGLWYILCGIAIAGLYVQASQNSYEVRMSKVMSGDLSIDSSSILALFKELSSVSDDLLFGKSINSLLKEGGISPLTVKEIVGMYNYSSSYSDGPGIVEKFLLNPSMSKIVDPFFTDSRTFESILKDGGKMVGNIKGIFQKYWDRKIASIMTSDNKEAAFRDLYSSVSPMMKKFLEARILQSGYDRQLGAFGDEIRASFANIFEFSNAMEVTTSATILKTLYNFVGVEKVNSMLLQDPIRGAVGQAIRSGRLEGHLMEGLESPFRSLLWTYYTQELQKIMSLQGGHQEQRVALEKLYGQQKWQFGEAILKEALVTAYAGSVREFIARGEGKDDTLRSFCEENLDKNVLGKAVVAQLKFLTLDPSFSADPEWRSRFFKYVMDTDLGYQNAEGLAEAMISFSKSYTGQELFGPGRDDVEDIYQLYYQRTGIAEKFLSDPSILKKVGKLIDDGALDKFLVEPNTWMNFDNLVKIYYTQKFQNFSLDEVEQEIKNLSESKRQQIAMRLVLEKYPEDFKIVNGALVRTAIAPVLVKPSSPIVSKAPVGQQEDLAKQEALLRRLYTQSDVLTEDQLIRLFNDLIKSKIFTGEWKFEFSRVPADARMSLIYAMETMQGGEKGIESLGRALVGSNIFNRFPKLWFVLANKCMEAQQNGRQNMVKMRNVLLGSLSKIGDSYSSLIVSQEKRGFFENLRNRCISWLKAWPIKKKYKGAKSDKDRFAQAVSFADGNALAGILDEKGKNTLPKYKKNPEDICREIGVILSKCSGKGVTFGQVRTLLSQLAAIKGVTRSMIDDEIVRRLPTQMQRLFEQEIQNLLDQDDFHNLVLDTTQRYIDALSRLNEQPGRTGGVDSTETTGKKPNGGSSHPTTTVISDATQARAKRLEEALEKKRALIDELADTQNTEILPDRPIEVR